MLLWLDTSMTPKCGIYVFNLSFHLLQARVHQVRVSERPDMEQLPSNPHANTGGEEICHSLRVSVHRFRTE